MIPHTDELKPNLRHPYVAVIVCMLATLAVFFLLHAVGDKEAARGAGLCAGALALVNAGYRLAMREWAKKDVKP